MDVLHLKKSKTDLPKLNVRAPWSFGKFHSSILLFYSQKRLVQLLFGGYLSLLSIFSFQMSFSKRLLVLCWVSVCSILTSSGKVLDPICLFSCVFARFLKRNFVRIQEKFSSNGSQMKVKHVKTFFVLQNSA